MKAVLLAVLASVLAVCPAAAQPRGAKPAASGPAPVEVMVLGTYHMANPGQDVRNLKADDVLTPERQREIRQVTEALARFRPTKVAVEWPAELVAKRWAEYRAGKLPPSRNEVVQLGFRLAQATGSEAIGIDAEGEFPFGPLAQFAEANGQGALLATSMKRVDAKVAEEQQVLKAGGVTGLLRLLNEPSDIAENHGLYMSTLRIGKGKQQPGVDLMSAWYRRNALICANLLQAVEPGDRVVVMFGSGHSHLLRQCVLETPGLRLVEPLAHLPKAKPARSRG